MSAHPRYSWMCAIDIDALLADSIFRFESLSTFVDESCWHFGGQTNQFPSFSRLIKDESNYIHASNFEYAHAFIPVDHNTFPKIDPILAFALRNRISGAGRRKAKRIYRCLNGLMSDEERKEARREQVYHYLHVFKFLNQGLIHVVLSHGRRTDRHSIASEKR